MKKIIICLSLCAWVSGSAFAATGSAVLHSTSDPSKELGNVQLQDTEQGLQITVMFTDAPPGPHGFHLHENGSCEDGGKAAGGHYNPDGVEHGLLPRDGYAHAHAGDFGNLPIKEDGTGTFKALIPKLTLSEGPYQAAGKAFILHEKADDFGQPTGNAGGRIGCGVVELDQ